MRLRICDRCGLEAHEPDDEDGCPPIGWGMVTVTHQHERGADGYGCRTLDLCLECLETAAAALLPVPDSPEGLDTKH